MSLNIFYLKDETNDYDLQWVHFKQTFADDKDEKLASAAGFDQYWFCFHKIKLFSRAVISIIPNIEEIV